MHYCFLWLVYTVYTTTIVNFLSCTIVCTFKIKWLKNGPQKPKKLKIFLIQNEILVKSLFKINFWTSFLLWSRCKDALRIIFRVLKEKVLYYNMGNVSFLTKYFVLCCIGKTMLISHCQRFFNALNKKVSDV